MTGECYGKDLVCGLALDIMNRVGVWGVIGGKGLLPDCIYPHVWNSHRAKVCIDRILKSLTLHFINLADAFIQSDKIVHIGSTLEDQASFWGLGLVALRVERVPLRLSLPYIFFLFPLSPSQ